LSLGDKKKQREKLKNPQPKNNHTGEDDKDAQSAVASAAVEKQKNPTRIF
jgi:hypothetical protein